ncbi:hypothetical protein PYW07_004680 [Mythimna separata]|uniref:Uncharacterized protein n=1 Tax=Mythimna separata TaxID=271217 RepID=A0AAD8DYC4_MYTSE|nr:hypothetical protein PYW07_004680 [Mythimna separata]
MKLLALLYAVGLISALQIVPEGQEIEYINHKYLKNMSITFRKLSRNSPHYVNMEAETNVGVGNNLTLKMELFENLGGHYIPTGIVGAYKLCDFLYNEPFFGKMYAKQFPGNWTCPFPSAMQIVPERHEIEFFNRKYLRNASITFRKLSRNSPHFVNLEVDSSIGVGNNFTATEIYPERVVMKSGNSCFHTISFTFRKQSRTSPYYINFDFNATCGYGNNVTIKWELSEYISGHYVPLPIRFEYRLCDFLDTDPYLGQMYAKQLRGNWSCPFPPATEVYPERLETIIKSTKYIHNITYTFRRHSRNSPYYIDFDYVATTGYGNNLTLTWKLNEFISGRYVPVPVQFQYKLCDFLYKDPFFGQMYAKQLVGNWSCPFPPGRSPFRNLVMHIENMPRVPFTYSSLIVRTRADLIIFMEEEIALVKIYLTATEIYPERLVTLIKSTKYIYNITFTYRRHTRTSPYYVDFDYISNSGYGNNLTGPSPFKSLVVHLENLPRIPFTYSSLIVRTQCILVIFMEEEIATLKIYMMVKQSMKKIDMNRWKGTILYNHTFD